MSQEDAKARKQPPEARTVIQTGMVIGGADGAFDKDGHGRRSAPLRAARQAVDAELAARIRVILRASDGTCGVPRITAELREDGEVVNGKRVARVMQASGRPVPACPGGIARPFRTPPR